MLTALNEAFLMEKQNDMYFTIWYGVWRVSERTLRFGSAGHPAALLVTPLSDGRRRVEPIRGPGMMLGGLSGTVYATHERSVPGAAQLYVVSDGTMEISRPDGSMWDQAEYEAFFAEPVPPGESELDRLLARARELHGPGPLDDDFSIVRFDL